MEKTGNKSTFIIIGIVLLVAAVPVVLLLLAFIAGFIFYRSGVVQ